MGRTIDVWLDRARAQLGDLGHQQRIDLHDLELGLQAALAEMSRDRPREVSETLPGTGTAFDFTLAATFAAGVSEVLEVEYPEGERQPVILDAQSWAVLRNTSTLRLFDATPSAVENVKITYTSMWPYPTATAGDDEIPEPFFDAVAALAASEAARAKAAELSRRRSKQVAGELIRDTAADDLFRLSAELRKVYRKVVLGVEGGSAGEASYQPAFSISDTDPSIDSIFHRGRR